MNRNLSHRAGNTVLGLVAALAWLVCAARGDDFDTLRLAWRDFVTGGTNLNLADSYIASRVAGAGSTANSYWSSMTKTTGRTNLWTDAASTTVSADLTTCYNRLSAMAQGWATAGSSVYSNASLAADLVSGLDWMYTNRYNETKSEYNNWWDWEIGVPLALNSCMTMIYPMLSGTQITNYCNAIDKFSPSVTMTGANRVWKAEAVGVRGVVGRNAVKVAAARDGLSDVAGSGASSVFTYVTTSDGFYRDGSFIQHTRHPYTAGYGLDLFRDLAKVLVWLDPTQWAVKDTQRTNVVHWCYDSYEPLIYYGAMPDHVRGREISRTSSGYSAGHAAINAILRVAQTAPTADAARLNAMVKYWSQADTTATLPSYADIDLVPAAERLLTNSAVTARGELIGHYQFPSMDRVEHLRPGFGFGLSLFSTRTYNYESINSENWHGWFTAYGLAYLWNNVDLTQFTDSFWPTVDPYHLPGTTVDLTVLANGANQSKTSTQPWVGGAVLSNSFGVAGLALADVNGSLAARKSWFMFDDEVVCLGAGITCSNATNVHTTVENRSLHTTPTNALAVDGVAMPVTLGWTSNLTHVTWCQFPGAGGYYFPGGANLSVQRVARTGHWSDINAGGSTTAITRDYLALIWDHGVAPTNATYAYVLLPNCSPSAVAQYAASPEITILTNTPAVQAVRETTLGIIAANFWTNSTRQVDALTASTCAAVIARETNGVLELCVSDPTWTNTGSVVVTYQRAATGLLSADAGVTVQQLSPAVQIAVNLSGARGKTFQTRFSLASAITAVADTVATGGSTPLLIDVLANDISVGPPLTLSGVTPSVHGTTALTNQLVSYLPAAGFAGTDTFNYFITDGARNATGMVSVAVGGGALTLTPAQVLASTNQPGNVPINTIDKDLSTRWSAEGDGQWIQYDLLSTQKVEAVAIAFYLGDQRRAYFDLNVSSDNLNWTQVYTGTNSGTTTNLERYPFTGRWCRYVRIVGHGNNTSDWNSITEVQVLAGTNAAPLAVSDSVSTAMSAPVTFNPLANDRDPDNGPQPLSLVTVSGPAHGSANPVSGGVRYLPAPGYIGPDSFSYVVTDTGLNATGLVAVTVTNLPTLPPVLAAISNRTLVAGATLTQTNLANDPNTPPQALVFSLPLAPAGASIDPDTGAVTWRPAIAQAGASNLFRVVVSQAGWQSTLVPSADASVRDGIYANSNFGADGYLGVKLSSAGSNWESFLKFNLATVPGALVGATLQLTPLVAAFPGVQAVAEVRNNAWSESTLTWSNRPGSGPVLATWTPQVGVTTTAPVTGAAQDALVNNGGILSLRLLATNTTADGMAQYGAREAASNAVPRLAVASSTGLFLSATQSFWVTVAEPPRPLLSVAPGAGRWALAIDGSAGPDYLIEATTNLLAPTNWVAAFSTNSPALPFVWTDPLATNYPARYYRVRLGP